MKLVQSDQALDANLVGPAMTTPTGSELVPLAGELAATTTAQTGQWQQAVDWLVLGGPIVWILIGLATIAIAVVLLKMWQFMMVGVERARPVREALESWDGGSVDGVIEQLRDKYDPASVVVSKALTGLANGFDKETVREECQRLANGQLERLRDYLRPLAFIGTTAPLLGLLGTVIGMIAAFQGIQEAGSQVDPTVLSGGIWAALLTTAVGLGVAIPVTMAHTWLERKLERLAHRIEDAVTIVFTAKLQPADREPLRAVATVNEPSATGQPPRATIGVVDSTGVRGAASA